MTTTLRPDVSPSLHRLPLAITLQVSLKGYSLWGRPSNLILKCTGQFFRGFLWKNYCFVSRWGPSPVMSGSSHGVVTPTTHLFSAIYGSWNNSTYKWCLGPPYWLVKTSINPPGGGKLNSPQDLVLFIGTGALGAAYRESGKMDYPVAGFQHYLIKKQQHSNWLRFRMEPKKMDGFQKGIFLF